MREKHFRSRHYLGYTHFFTFYTILFTFTLCTQNIIIPKTVIESGAHFNMKRAGFQKRASFLVYYSVQKATWLFKKLAHYFWRFTKLLAFSDPENM